MVTIAMLKGAFESVEQLDKAVGIVAQMTGKLKAKPDLAAQKLSEALGEVAKTLESVDGAASDFLSLGIDEGALARNSKLLLSITGGGLGSKVEQGRGSCHAIGRIYDKYLDKWFSRAFKQQEYESVRNVFWELGNADSNLFFDLERVAQVLEKEAEEVLNFVIAGNEADARQCVLSSLPVLSQLRKKISQTMRAIFSAQSDFMDIMEAI